MHAHTVHDVQVGCVCMATYLDSERPKCQARSKTAYVAWFKLIVFLHTDFALCHSFFIPLVCLSVCLSVLSVCLSVRLSPLSLSQSNTHTHPHTHTPTRRHEHTHARTHAHAHTHTRKHTCTHIHSQTQSGQLTWVRLRTRCGRSGQAGGRHMTSRVTGDRAWWRRPLKPHRLLRPRHEALDWLSQLQWRFGYHGYACTTNTCTNTWLEMH